MTDRHTVDSINSDQLDQLYADLDQARATNRRLNLRAQQLESELATYRRAVDQWEISERGTYVPLRTLAAIAKAAGRDIENPRWLLHYQRVEQAETALREILGCLLPVHAGDDIIGYEPPLPVDAGAVDRWRAALDEKRPEPDPAWTPPPPGDRREQLPDHLLALLDIPAYTSTACETAELLAAAVVRHPERSYELRYWEDRQRQRCRINNKYTGVICQHATPEPDFTSPIAGRIEVRDPCPWCEDCPLIPRTLMAGHVATVHPEVKTGGPGIPMPDAESVIDCTTACDEQHTYDWTCALFAGADDSDPADLTGYITPEPGIRCLNLAAEPTPSQRPGLRDQLADATVPLLLDTLPKVIARARGYEVADVVMALLYREWPWLRAEAEERDQSAATLAAITAEAERRGVISIDGIRNIVKETRAAGRP